MFNGDSHEYKSDNPFAPTDPAAAMHPGYDVKNFRRVVVHGSTTPMEWLKLTINPALRNDGPTSVGPFSWTRMVHKI